MTGGALLRSGNQSIKRQGRVSPRVLQVASLGLLLAGTAALAKPPSEIERYYLGHYIVKSEDSKRTICRAEIAWANDVGGEFASQGCDGVPALRDATRWFFNADAGEVRFEDPLHKTRFRLAETDAGFIAILPDESRYWFETAPRAARAASAPKGTQPAKGAVRAPAKSPVKPSPKAPAKAKPQAASQR